ncbi:MAG TPA: DNA-3-methyladenine glycosylase 2 family protein [Firmicutes bacterium]|jgi:DNA-3-methyladenine glycosylase II|nr:DNA-3-methyladenine glycosylase 2 family protein [Bacillota bacterium]
MSKPRYFVYGATEIEHLASRDKKLGEAIEKIGPIKREVYPELFPALVQSIVGQQISTKAQETIWGRMQERFTPFTPDVLAKSPVEELQSCGISMRKAIYIHETAQAIVEGQVDLNAFSTMSDEDVCKELVKLKGIGIWTAEMLLTFSLQRPDIVSFGDLAIHRGMRMLYRHRKITPELFAKYKRRYSPHGTIASLYLWAIAGGALSELTDPAPRQK